MRLRYHNLDLPGQRCISVLSLEPQVRSIFTQSGHGRISLPWPNIIFSFRYNKVEGGYLYPGLYGDGLRVLLRGKPLKNFEDHVACSPTEHHANAQACTDHGWDNSVFKEPTEMFATILEIWWGSPHLINQYYGCTVDIKKWQAMSMDEVGSYNWQEKAPLRGYIPGLPADAEIQDEPVGVLKSVFKRGPKLYGR